MATEAEPNQDVEPIKYKGVEVRSIDWVPDRERHGKLWPGSTARLTHQRFDFGGRLGWLRGPVCTEG